MSFAKVHVLHTGQVCVSPDLPFGGDGCNPIKASGVLGPRSRRLWLPVSVYYIEHPHGRILVDTGWHRDMSPDGTFDKKAQVASLGSLLLYETNQGRIEKGAAVDEQLAAMGVSPSDLDLVILTHLDCDHANGLSQVKGAKRIIVSRAEMEQATRRKGTDRIRYQARWWDGVDLEVFDWNAEAGPFGRSYDVFGDGQVQCINIPGHSDGQCAVKLVNPEGGFVLLFADGGYAVKSWREQISSGIATDKEEQKRSLAWIRDQCLDPNCIESLANHDPDVSPHVIEL